MSSSPHSSQHSIIVHTGTVLSREVVNQNNNHSEFYCCVSFRISIAAVNREGQGSVAEANITTPERVGT